MPFWNLSKSQAPVGTNLDDEPGFVDAVVALVGNAAQDHEIALPDGLPVLPGADSARLNWLDRAVNETVAWQMSRLDGAKYELFHYAPGTLDYDAALDDVRAVEAGATTVRALRLERRDLIASCLDPNLDVDLVPVDARFDPLGAAEENSTERVVWLHEALRSTFDVLTSNADRRPRSTTAQAHAALLVELRALTDLEQRRANDVASGRYRTS